MEMNELVLQLRRLRHGDHSCLLYETPEEQRAAIVPFFKEGLDRGERCQWIADDRTLDEVKGFLFDAGIDVASEIRRGAFRLLTKRESYLKDGAFDPRAMIHTLGETVRETLADGFTGLRGSGEMTWALGDEEGCDRAIEYEAILNDFIPGKPFVAICQYNRRRFQPRITLDVLRTHPYAILGELVCPNLYFEPSELFLGDAAESLRLDWKLTQLRRAREDARALEDAIRAREAFFAVAGHELRTPIATLQLQVDVVSACLSQRDPHAPELTRLQGALNQIHRLTELANRLLDVTQLHAHGLELVRRRIDLAEIVGEQLSRRRADADAAHCTVEADLRSASGDWDRARIDQVIANLLANAFKYGRGKPIHIDVRPQGKMAVLTVRDEGIGIALEDQSRIFGPFERAVSERHYSGFGVGLWTVQQIVEAHGGSVRVESAPAQGATFSVWLPAQPAEQERCS